MKLSKELFYTAVIGSWCMILGFAFTLVTYPRTPSHTAATPPIPAATACCGVPELAQMSAACSFTPAVTVAAAGAAHQAGVIATTVEVCNCKKNCNCAICYCNEHLSK